jgi:hypothetical protein
MRGWSVGRPFASYIFLTASAFLASAPRPYTVSVGNATKWPAISDCAAAFIESVEHFDKNTG